MVMKNIIIQPYLCLHKEVSLFANVLSKARNIDSFLILYPGYHTVY